MDGIATPINIQTANEATIRKVAIAVMRRQMELEAITKSLGV
jgi:hypothetical protein